MWYPLPPRHTSTARASHRNVTKRASKIPPLTKKDDIKKNYNPASVGPPVHCSCFLLVSVCKSLLPAEKSCLCWVHSEWVSVYMWEEGDVCDKHHCLKAFFFPFYKLFWVFLCLVWWGEVDWCWQRGGAGVDWCGVCPSVSDPLGGSGPCDGLVSERLIAIMDDPWWQRQVKPSHMWGGHTPTERPPRTQRDTRKGQWATFATCIVKYWSTFKLK